VVEKPVRWARSARKHKIGKAHALFVMDSVEPVLVPATEQRDARLLWEGNDDRGLKLEIIALDLPDRLIVIHVMPKFERKRR
jgi:hypothetical protein